MVACVDARNHDDIMRLLVRERDGVHAGTCFFVGDSSVALTARHAVERTNNDEIYLESRVGQIDRGGVNAYTTDSCTAPWRGLGHRMSAYRAAVKKYREGKHARHA